MVWSKTHTNGPLSDSTPVPLSRYCLERAVCVTSYIPRVYVDVCPVEDTRLGKPIGQARAVLGETVEVRYR